MKEMIKVTSQFKVKPETKQVKVPREAGSMRFTKCGTFRGFKFE